MKPREQLAHDLRAASQQRMNVAALRNSTPVNSTSGSISRSTTVTAP